MLDIGLTHYLVLSAFVFCCGIACMALKRNAIGILIGVELVLNSANLNFVAFGRYRVGGLDGQITPVFVIALAAAEAAVALAIFLNFYSSHATVDVDRGSALKG
jgi:NADH-quinone oxidoreductase subunit K